MCGPKLLRHSGQEGREDRYAVTPPEHGRIAAGGIPDTGEQRSFPDPKAARLEGIKPDKLAKPVADQLKKAFK